MSRKEKEKRTTQTEIVSRTNKQGYAKQQIFKKRKCAIYGRRNAPKTPPVVLLGDFFDTELTNGNSRTEVGSTSDTLRTEVGSTVDGDADDGDEDVTVLTHSERIWNEEDLLDDFVETRTARDLGIGYYY